ncbi:helix-turn-helix transcriptional regulator [Nitratiruptor tergarcus]|uniref:Predicted DNA-binding transcriptional regulator YafY, contains an HTH and WYL domains n=1 Tax=Nitratiruptor tergarcus DSM 16512 TaxID=1069081 RepID=A0A1W1WV48_9BACT|nr:WYL domain-containing protein [Nitratiruptor tergarcus]SMC10062.1 Predicted DNA-binding transcriptional regulator YafY, contains an HTH and WYL domains [Nitratiruptor tergarcus DSM 16512]
MKNHPFNKQHHTTKESRIKKYKNVNECIAKILARLYDGKTLSMKELAKECQVSKRTIQRYVNERLAYFPIKKDGDLFSLDWVKEKKIDWSEEEIAVLEMLDNLSKNQGSAFYEKAHKILKKINSFNPYYTRLDIEKIDDFLPILIEIEKAIKEHNIIQFRYTIQESFFNVTVKPFQIANFQGFWYLVAEDMKDGVIKKYLLRQIAQVKISDEKFTPPKNLHEKISKALSIWFDPDIEPFEVRLFIDGKVAKYFKYKPLAPSQIILGEDQDGSIEIALKITHEMEIIPIIKQWLPHIRVLEPKWLDEMIKEDIKTYLDEF